MALAEPRQQEIADILRSGGQAAVADLARRFNVSEMTIRRDLQALENLGLAVRVHGGAIPGERSRFTSRLTANSRSKVKAVQKLQPFLPRSGCIYLDGSTTVLNLVRLLKGFTGLHVATNNVETFNRVAALHGPQPLLLGGRLDLRTDNLIGPLAIRSVESLVFETAFFSAWGLRSDTGLNEVTVEDAEVKERVAARSSSVMVAVDHPKLEVSPAGTWNHRSETSVLATDLDPGDDRLHPYIHLFSSIV